MKNCIAHEVSRMRYITRNATRNMLRFMRHTSYCIPHTPARAARGFTLIEMLVVIAVMAIVTGVMLANNGRFGGQVLLQNLAYDIALTLRHAQVYGISVLRFEATASYAPGFEVHFLTS